MISMEATNLVVFAIMIASVAIGVMIALMRFRKSQVLKHA